MSGSFFVSSQVLCLISIMAHEPPPSLLLPVCLWNFHLYAISKVNQKNKVGGARGQCQCCGRELLAMDPIALLALALLGKSNRWIEDKMFATNKQLLGCKTTATHMKRGLTSRVRNVSIRMPSG